MKIVTFKPTKQIDDGFYLPGIDILFVSDKANAKSTEDVILFLSRNGLNKSWMILENKSIIPRRK